ncbi:MAG: sulfurtransferase [Geothermobacteraceae bacterium]
MTKPKPLVSPQWLHNNLGNPDVRVIENAWEQSAYTRAHIAGAVPVPIHPHLKHFDPEGHKTSDLLSQEDFRHLCHALGMRRHRHYVIYDDWHGLFSARFWWVCRFYGFDNVSVLNGGWQGWLAQGRPVSSTIQHPSRGTDIEPAPRPELRIRTEELIQAHNDPNIQIWDTRRPSEYDGREQTGNRHAGHIPGAFNLVWTDLLQPAATEGGARFFLPPEQMGDRIDKLGLNPDKTVIPYCQSGIRAAFGFFALHLLGYDKLRLYDASMMDWANRDDTPMTA